MHEFIGSLFALHQSLTSTRFCREMKQNAITGVDREKLLGCMYVVNLTPMSQLLFARQLLLLSHFFVSSSHCTVNVSPSYKFYWHSFQ